MGVSVPFGPAAT